MFFLLSFPYHQARSSNSWCRCSTSTWTQPSTSLMYLVKHSNATRWMCFGCVTMMGLDKLTLCHSQLQECHRGSLAWDHAVVPEQQSLWSALWPHQKWMWQWLCLFLLCVVHLPLLLLGKLDPISPIVGALVWIPPSQPFPPHSLASFFSLIMIYTTLQDSFTKTHLSFRW